MRQVIAARAFEDAAHLAGHVLRAMLSGLIKDYAARQVHNAAGSSRE